LRGAFAERDLADQDLGQRLARSRQGHAQVVEQAVPRDLERLVRELFVADAAYPRDERPRRSGLI
jgi:hypothetical protein